MKKYRAKIDTPWGGKGTLILNGLRVQKVFELGATNAVDFSPSQFPDMFEEIEEKSDVEKLADWLSLVSFGCDTARECSIKLAKALLEKGFDVSKLGDE